MTTFLISNLVVSSCALLYLRFSQSNFSVKLAVASFSLICWVIPFTLIKGIFPSEIAINTQWILPLSEATEQAVSTTFTSTFDWLSLANVFIVLCFFGLGLFCWRVAQQQLWQSQVKQHSSFRWLMQYQGVSVFSSEKVDSAILVGYSHPQIWINERLANSKSLKVILAHETTHLHHKDNYWLMLLALLKSIYWWNPLINIMVNNAIELLENRCDYHASKKFTEGVYQLELAELLLTKLPVTHAGLVSAVMSKNSNINRIQILSEKQIMTTYSRLTSSILIALFISFLALPFNSLSHLVAHEIEETDLSEGISLNFVDIAVAPLSQLVAQFYELEAVVAPELVHQLVTVELISIPQHRMIDELQEQLNIAFIVDGKKLLVKSLPGGITQIAPSQLAIQSLNLSFTYQKNSEQPVIHSIESRAAQWGSFEQDDMVIEYIANMLNSEKVALNFKVYQRQAQQLVLITTPSVITSIDKAAMFQVGEKNNIGDFQGFTLNVTAKKIAAERL